MQPNIRQPNPKGVKKYAGAFKTQYPSMPRCPSVPKKNAPRRVRAFAKQFPPMVYDPKNPISHEEMKKLLVKGPKTGVCEVPMKTCGASEAMAEIGREQSKLKHPELAITETTVARMPNVLDVRIRKGRISKAVQAVVTVTDRS